MDNLKKAGLLAGVVALAASGITAYTSYMNRPRVEIIAFSMRTGTISDYERGCLASSQRIEKASEDRLAWAKENGIRPRPSVVRYSRVMKPGLTEAQYQDECTKALISGGSVNFENRLRLSSLQ